MNRYLSRIGIYWWWAEPEGISHCREKQENVQKNSPPKYFTFFENNCFTDCSTLAGTGGIGGMRKPSLAAAQTAWPQQPVMRMAPSKDWSWFAELRMP